MKAYVLTSGIVFALIVVAHGLRLSAEGTRLLTEPSFLLTTALALGLTLWAARTLRRIGK